MTNGLGPYLDVDFPDGTLRTRSGLASHLIFALVAKPHQ
jgi:hypothetical protein